MKLMDLWNSDFCFKDNSLKYWGEKIISRINDVENSKNERAKSNKWWWKFSLLISLPYGHVYIDNYQEQVFLKNGKEKQKMVSLTEVINCCLSYKIQHKERYHINLSLHGNILVTSIPYS